MALTVDQHRPPGALVGHADPEMTVWHIQSMADGSRGHIVKQAMSGLHRSVCRYRTSTMWGAPPEEADPDEV